MCCGWLYTCSGAPLIIMHLNMLAVTVLMLFTYTASIFERHFSLNTRVASCFATAAIVVCVLDQLYLRSAEVISTCLHFSRVHVPSWCLCSSTATGLLTQHEFPPTVSYKTLFTQVQRTCFSPITILICHHFIMNLTIEK